MTYSTDWLKPSHTWLEVGIPLTVINGVEGYFQGRYSCSLYQRNVATGQADSVAHQRCMVTGMDVYG